MESYNCWQGHTHKCKSKYQGKDQEGSLEVESPFRSVVVLALTDILLYLLVPLLVALDCPAGLIVPDTLQVDPDGHNHHVGVPHHCTLHADQGLQLDTSCIDGETDQDEDHDIEDAAYR